jgi:hypothetical protein
MAQMFFLNLIFFPMILDYWCNFKPQKFFFIFFAFCIFYYFQDFLTHKKINKNEENDEMIKITEKSSLFFILFFLKIGEVKISL